MAFFMIVYYHLLVQLEISSICPHEVIGPLYSSINLHMATFSVALFFILAGASLAYTTPEDFSIGSFYKKRFLKLLVPFYVTVFFYNVYKICKANTVTVVFVPGIPKWRWIFTLLGLDQWLGMQGVQTFTNGVGEWFLGVLLILYLLFPIMYKIMLKDKRFFAIISTVIFLFVAYSYDKTSIVPIYQNIFLKGYEFVIGMMIGKYCITTTKKVWILSVPYILFMIFSKFFWNENDAVKITLSAVSVVNIFSYFESFFKKHMLKIVKILSDYSYEVFLVHHIIIGTTIPLLSSYMTNTYRILIVFVFEIIVVVVFAVLLKRISKCVFELINKLMPI